jgi:hypothetical protein
MQLNRWKKWNDLKLLTRILEVSLLQMVTIKANMGTRFFVVLIITKEWDCNLSKIFPLFPIFISFHQKDP